MIYVIVRRRFHTTPETITIFRETYSTEKEAVKAARADYRKLKRKLNETTASDANRYFDMYQFDCYGIDTGKIYADWRIVAVTKFDAEELLNA